MSGQVLVRYFLHQYCHQAPPSDTFLSNPADEILRDSEQTWDSFVIDTEPGAALTLGDIMDGFPLEGSFHFRFKMGYDEGHCWLDVNDPDASVPRFCECVYMKVRHNEVLGRPTDPKYFRTDSNVWEESLGWSCPNSSLHYAESDAKPRRSSLSSANTPTNRSEGCADLGADVGEASDTPRVFIDPAPVIDAIQRKIEERFDPDEPAHLTLLKELFQAVFPGQQLDGVESVHWTTIGLPDLNPVPTLRATHCSIIGLHCLVYFIENYFGDAHRMIVDNTTAEGGYSIMLFGLGVGEMLVQCMGFDVINGIHPSTVTLLREPQGFEEIFSALMLYGDFRWKAGKETSLDALIKKLQERVIEALEANPTSVISFKNYATRSKDFKSQATESLGKAKEGIASALSGFKKLFG